jgi:hypothetical protein
MKDGPSFHTRHRVTREPLSEFHRTPLLPPVTAQSEGEVLPRLYPSPDLEARHLPHYSRETPITSIGANMPGHFDVSPFPERWFLPDDWRDRAWITGHPDARWGNIPSRDRLAFSLHFRLARGACWTMLPDGP